MGGLKYKKELLIMIVLYIAVALRYGKQGPKKVSPITQRQTSPHVKYYDEVFMLNTDTPLILFWTKYYNVVWVWYYRFFNSNHCSPWNCLTTDDKTQIDIADVVVFSLDDVVLEELPCYRRENQIWVAFTREPPQKLKLRNKNLELFKGLFNWTVTYRSDSEVTYIYGHVAKRRENITTKIKHPWILTEDEKNNFFPKWEFPTWDYDATLQKLPSRNGSALILISNCEKNKRLKYARELAYKSRRLLEVEINGECGRGSTRLPANFDYSEEKYKFYLSFENNECKDYVTEKLYKVFQFDIVPIVMGGVNYDDVAPPHSYINVKDFETPYDLGKYLHYLHNNHTAYMEYFLWKKDYFTTLELDSAFPCRFCEALKNPILKKSYDIKGFYEKESNCEVLEQDYDKKGNDFYWME